MSNQIELTPEQYESVLKYMEATSQEDYDNAVRLLRNHEFNLQMAINSRFTGSYDQAQSQPLQNRINQQNSPANHNPNNQEQIRKYLQFQRQKQNRSFFLGIYSFTKSLVFGLFNGISQLLLPQFLKRKIIRSEFYNQYVDEIPINIKDSSLTNLLRDNYLGRKPIMFILGNVKQKYQCFLQIMNDQRVAKKIAQSFIVTGTSFNDQPLRNQAGKYTPLKQQEITQPPSILIIRQNLLQQPQIVYKFVGENQISSINIDTLNLVIRAHQYQNRKDNNTKIKYRNYIRSQYYRGRPGYYQQQLELQQDYIPQQNFRHQPSSSMSSAQSINKNKSQMIQQQNLEYQRIAQQVQQRQRRQQQEQKKLQQIVEQRKVRKMSIPDQPIQGQNIIRINFRCPDGSMITRNFLDNQKIDLLYQWVQTNEEIQFQQPTKREFQLLYSFPPTSLCGKKQQLLSKVFDSDQQKLMIRQL